MCDDKKSPVEFDYTSFLGESCSKKWTFLEALASVAPVFGEAWKETTKQDSDPDSRLWEMALQSLSTSRSDESNLVSLIRLARDEHIDCLQVIMPYSLDADQIETIQAKGNASITAVPDEDLLIAVIHA